jgi:hypothetical protein
MPRKYQQQAALWPSHRPTFSAFSGTHHSAENRGVKNMRSFILGTMTAVVVALGASTAVFAAPAFAPHEHGGRGPSATNIQRTDYYWSHHHYQHRDWDRHHHHWRYYD